MKRDLQKLQQQSFDLLVIGGGINGAAAAHLAVIRGLKTALIEKNDFASGTSSKSSKLMHGGIRYLENFEFGLVREALHERAFHTEKLGHLVRPMPFVIPVYDGDRRPLWMMKAGVLLYDLLAGSKNIGRRQMLNRETLLRAEPGLNPEGLRGGVLYYDALMDDVRVCLENLLEAGARGAVLANYVEACGFIKKDGIAEGVLARDRLHPQSPAFEIRARHIAVCGGAWTDSILQMDEPGLSPKVRPTKGAHMIIDQKISDRAMLIPARRDKRIFFVIPWKTGTMIGTTDTDYSGSPDDVKADDEDVNYLLEETRRVFPSLALSRQDVRITFAGLRPLLKNEGTASKISREHEIFQSASRVFYIAGGKYTTYRSIAEDFVGRLAQGPTIEHFFSEPLTEPPETLGESCGVTAETAAYLAGLYGSRLSAVMALCQNDPALKARIHPAHPAILAQAVYARENEMAQTVDDLIFRRLMLGYVPGLPRDFYPAAREKLSRMGFSLNT